MAIETRSEFPIPAIAHSRASSGESAVAATWLAQNVLENWRTALAVAATTVACAVAYMFAQPPTYKADALVRIEAPKESALRQLASISRVFEVSDPNVLGEIEVLRSRTTIETAIEKINGHLTIRVLNSFPLVGTSLESWLPHDADGLGIPQLGLTSLAWGGEHVDFSAFDVPDRWEGSELSLIVREQGGWSLLDPDGNTVAGGHIGQEVRAANGHLRIKVTAIRARPGTKFGITRNSLQQRYRDISDTLQVTESAPQSNTISVSYKDRNPVFAAALVNAITGTYLSLDSARRTEEAHRSLQFLEGQLPRLRRQLDQSAAAFNEFRTKVGTVDVDGQIKDLLEQGQTLDRLRVDLELKRDELSQRFAGGHPLLAAVNTKLASVRSELERLSLRMSSMPETQQTFLRMAGDVQVNTQLYASLLESEQQLRLAQAGMVGNATVIDQAVVADVPTWPKPSVVLAGGVLLGLGAAFAACQLVALRVRRLRDANSLESASGAEVLTVIPHAREQKGMETRNTSGSRLLVQEGVTNPTVAALRNLRTAIRLRVPRTEGGRAFLVSSPVRGQGGSFVACNLARLLAGGGESVLLIDAKLSGGSAPAFLGIELPSRGLAQVMMGTAKFSEAVIAVGNGLSYLPAGAVGPDTADALQPDRLQSLLEQLKRQYAWIVVDAPSVADSGDIGLLATTCVNVLLVCRHEKTSLIDISHAVRELHKFGGYVIGSVLNDYRRGALLPQDGYSRTYDDWFNRDGRARGFAGSDSGNSGLRGGRM